MCVECHFRVAHTNTATIAAVSTRLGEDFMDSLNKNFIWLIEVSPAFAKELSGTFVTLLDGARCDLELALVYKSLRGSLKLDGEVFEIRGVVSSVVKAAYGVLLEPVSNTPVALLRITPERGGVVLELDMPDFDDFVNLYEPRAFQFRRASALLI